MALLHGIYSVRLQDFLGVKGTQTLYFQIADTHTLADLVTAAADMNSRLDPLTDAMGLRTRIELFGPTTGLKTSISVKNRLESGALFTFNQANINRAFGITIPAFAEAKIVNGKVDLTDTDVQNFITEVTLSSGVDPKESNVQNLLPAFLSVRLNDRKYRKSDTRLTSET